MPFLGLRVDYCGLRPPTCTQHPHPHIPLQVFQYHYMRYLYTLFADKPPQYILDAGERRSGLLSVPAKRGC